MVIINDLAPSSTDRRLLLPTGSVTTIVTAILWLVRDVFSAWGNSLRPCHPAR